jgi:hypothetical protein
MNASSSLQDHLRQERASAFIVTLIAAAAAVVALLAVTASPADGAIVTRPILKTFFQSGDKPTQEQFSTLLDSMVNYTDDRQLLGLRVYDPAVVYLPGDAAAIKRFGIGDTAPASPVEYADPHRNPPLMADDFAGHFGFAAFRLADTSGLGDCYGFMQIQMDPLPPPAGGNVSGADAPTVEPPGIFVEYIAFETTPNTPITTFLVPEPACGAAVGLFLVAAARQRRRRSIG